MDASTEIREIETTLTVRKDAEALLDITLGVAAVAVDTAGAVGRRVRAVAGPLVGPVAGLALRPPLVTGAYQPVTLLRRLAEQGREQRAALQREASRLLDAMVPGVAAAMLERIDVNDIVQRHVDLDKLIGTVDLAGLTESVIAEVDLPEIIRQSTGSMASEAVRGVRMQGISGDEAVGRAMDRLRLRRRRKASAVAPPESEPAAPGVPDPPQPGPTLQP